MRKTISLSLEPSVAFDDVLFKETVLKNFPQITDNQIIIQKTKQTIDARNKQVKVLVEAEVFINEAPEPLLSFQKNYPNVSKAKQAIIVGAGPAGMFAALRLIELGIKPILLERGNDVRARRRDLAAINKGHYVNPESNYCFGEGGAGTYSDGKLYTRSKKRGDVRRVLEILVSHGATPAVLYEAHPHIGTNKLPQVVMSLRESILAAGGEVHFNTKVIDFILQNNEIKGVITNKNEEIQGIGVILATGHSARDIFELLDKKNILIEAKPFAMGVRVEHQQNLIDTCQYHRKDRGILPAAAYSLVTQTHYKGVQRGVFSFCMCPGGFIVPAATAGGEIVVNGMSPSRRDSPFANSGVVVAINEVDWQKHKHLGALAGLELQKSVEQRAFQLALEVQGSRQSDAKFKVQGAKFNEVDASIQDLEKISQSALPNSQFAPAQRVMDFVNKKTSDILLPTSYQPGLVSMSFDEVLPDIIAQPLREALKDFGKKIIGYVSNEAQMIGIESRTSSPVRVPRDKETLEHLQIKRFFPCGEGAGYAGGIVSAAMDGERCAEQLAKLY